MGPSAATLIPIRRPAQAGQLRRHERTVAVDIQQREFAPGVGLVFLPADGEIEVCVGRHHRVGLGAGAKAASTARRGVPTRTATGATPAAAGSGIQQAGPGPRVIPETTPGPATVARPIATITILATSSTGTASTQRGAYLAQLLRRYLTIRVEVHRREPAGAIGTELGKIEPTIPAGVSPCQPLRLPVGTVRAAAHQWLAVSAHRAGPAHRTAGWAIGTVTRWRSRAGSEAGGSDKGGKQSNNGLHATPIRKTGT